MSSDGAWMMLVTVHNVSRVPKEVSTLTTPGIKFRVAVNAAGGDVNSTSTPRSCPEVSATFEPKDVQAIQSNHYEVKLDGTSSSGRGSAEWSCGSSTIDVVISIKEETASEGSKTIATSSSFTVDVEQLVERTKLKTLIIGTSMGCVGVSFAVAPSDTAGYRRRLEAFLTRYNATGLRLVASVVASVSELDTFTKVNKKYNLVDYLKRVRKFFSTYGPDHMTQCAAILKQWENREEELMRNLILDNGPELVDVDLRTRLAAYAKKYKLPPQDFDVAQLVRLHKNDPEPFFEELVAKYGAEPDPRLYLFGPTYYGERAPQQDSPKRASPTRRGTESTNSAPVPSSRPPAVTPPPQPPAPAPSSAPPIPQQSAIPPPQQQQSAAVAPSYVAQQQTTQNTQAQLIQQQVQLQQQLLQQQQQQPLYAAPQPVVSSLQRPTQSTSSNSANAQLSVMELWSNLIEDLRNASIPAAELHYLSESSFLTLLGELGYSSTSKQLLATEWHRRIGASLRTEQLSNGDSLFEAAKRDVITISGLHPLNVNVVGVTLLKNSEHEASFSLRLQDAKLRTTERLIIVGDHSKLLGFATNGVSSQQSQLDPSQPACAFFRKPFYAFQRMTSVSALVCDVVVGKPFIGASSTSEGSSQLTTPKEGSPTFLKEYDSCVFFDPVAGQAVAVYQPQQVLPKYLVQCNVDSSVIPCPAHPSKPVEFFIAENNAFACSQCVVMGQYRGAKDVLTVEDATLQARSQLQDLQRDVLNIVSEMAASEADCDRQLQSLPHSELRLNANRQIELIRREAEQKIAAIQLELESYERQKKDGVVDVKNQAKRVMDEAQKLSGSLDEGLRLRGPSEIISLLINLRRSGVVDNVRERATSVRAVASPENLALPAPSFAQQQQPPASLTSLQQQPSLTAASTSQFISSSRMPSVTNRIPSFGAPLMSSTQAGEDLNRTPRNGVPSSFLSAPSQSVNPPPLQPQQTNFLANNQAGDVSSTTAPDASSLYSKFLNIKQQGAQLAQTPSASLFAQDEMRHPSAVKQAQRVTADLEAKRMKDLITSGWAEFRKGDKQAAQRIWTEVYERNVNNAIGARARAYIAEAIEKNYAAASQWYEKALEKDPQDCLTLYNYGVLLESVLDRKVDALQLFETAHRLGDQTAGKRAAQLRQSIR